MNRNTIKKRSTARRGAWLHRATARIVEVAREPGGATAPRGPRTRYAASVPSGCALISRMIASVISRVLAVPPMSGVRCSFLRVTAATPRRIRP